MSTFDIIFRLTGNNKTLPTVKVIRKILEKYKRIAHLVLAYLHIEILEGIRGSKEISQLQNPPHFYLQTIQYYKEKLKLLTQKNTSPTYLFEGVDFVVDNIIFDIPLSEEEKAHIEFEREFIWSHTRSMLLPLKSQ